MKFRKKPVIIEAIRFTRDTADQVTEFMKMPPFGFKEGMISISIHTLEGVMTAIEGDWIVKGESPERGVHFWPVKPDYFSLNYEPVEEEMDDAQKGPPLPFPLKK